MPTTRQKKIAKRVTRRSSAKKEALRLLVAVDEPSASANAIIDTAAALAKAHRAATSVVSVLNPYAVAGALLGVPIAEGASLRAEQRRRRVELRRYLGDRIGARRPWAVHVPLGNPGDTIVDSARAADLVVMGLHRERLVERIIHDATAQHVVGSSAVPVLAVTPDLRGMPHVVMVAVDFSRESTAAARLACTLFSQCSRLVFVHVESEFDAAMAKLDEAARLAHESGWAAAFERLLGALPIPDGVMVETVVLGGTVPAELIAFATRRGADVLVAARKHHALAERVIAGSATAGLLRRAPCSLLITPPNVADASGRRRPPARR